MAIRRVLRAVTKNFLGTFTSRYTDRHGYWLFGFLPDEPLNIDLQGDRSRRGDDPCEDARMSAMKAFLDQLNKAKFPEARLRDARLSISTSRTPVERMVGGYRRTGREMTFAIVVTPDRGQEYRAICTKFVAPHDSSIERRSARASEPQ
jgi:hypothetical protein